MKKSILETSKALIIAVVVIFGLGTAHAWNGPTGIPPTNNVPNPLTASSDTQEKPGILGFKGFYSLGKGTVSTSSRSVWPANLTFAVNGSVGAVKYCDDNGLNCHSTSEIGLPVPPLTGVVMAFDLAACPVGWSPYAAAAGRNIVGTGPGYAMGATGGEASHTMIAAEMVPHTHSTSHAHGATIPGKINSTGDNIGSGSQIMGMGSTAVNLTGSGFTGPTGNAGASAPFNILDPYIALTYCKKN